MPKRRTRLSKKQQARYRELALELQTMGVDCEIPEELQEYSRNLDIFGDPPWGNILRELSTGVTECAIWVRLVAPTSNLILENFRIAFERDSELIALSGNARGLYSFGNEFEFTECETLNHRIENGLHLRRPGDVAQGWLLASAHKPIPDKYRNGMITELRLTFTDQFGHDHSAQAKAILERSARLSDSGFRVNRVGTGLYGGRRGEARISGATRTSNDKWQTLAREKTKVPGRSSEWSTK
jgi:hypothetical protein